MKGIMCALLSVVLFAAPAFASRHSVSGQHKHRKAMAGLFVEVER